MRDLQLSYLKSGVSNHDVPQDHAYFAAMYNFAIQNKIKIILSGGNIATEGISPDWMFDPLDVANLNSIQKQFGEHKLITFPKVSFFNDISYILFL